MRDVFDTLNVKENVNEQKKVIVLKPNPTLLAKYISTLYYIGILF